MPSITHDTHTKTRRHGCSLISLPNEMLVEEMMFRLDVEDILTLRRVNKLFFQLSHTPVIWKRLLRLMNIVPPPLPPSKRYNMEFLTGLEAQKMVIRSISFNNNWRSQTPRVYNTRSIALQHNVLSMVVLPGGKHLAASVANKDCTAYSLMVLVVDRQGGVVPLATMPTTTKAYRLQAKYMTVNGTSTIVIGYVRREFYGNLPSSLNPDPSHYGDENTIDPPFPLRYECTAVSISLETLEDLSDPNNPPGSSEFLQRAKARPSPFSRLSTIRTRSPLTTVDLAIVGGVPYLAVVKSHESIVFKNLNTRSVSSLTIRRWQECETVEHQIHNFRILPYQKELLLVLSIPLAPLAINPHIALPPPNSTPRVKHEHLVACIYPLPHDGEDIRDILPYESQVLENGTDFEHIQISDPAVPSHMDRSIRPLSLQPDIPYISIYYRNLAKGNLVEMRVPPYHPSSTQRPPVPFFDRATNIWETRYYITDAPHLPVIANVLPGHSRPLLWTTPQSNRTHAPPLLNFVSQLREGYNVQDAHQAKNSHPSICIRQKPARSSEGIPVQLPVILRQRLQAGIKGLAWDDWSGIIFAVTLNDCAIHVIELGSRLTDYSSDVLSSLALK